MRGRVSQAHYAPCLRYVSVQPQTLSLGNYCGMPVVRSVGSGSAANRATAGPAARGSGRLRPAPVDFAGKAKFLMQRPIPVPIPSVLDASGPHLAGAAEQADAEKQLAVVREAMEAACDYGRQLWRDVDALRSYLLRSLPSDPSAPGPHTGATSPRGPDDDTGWQDWVGAYGEASSVLAGPDGDSGFGLKQAQHEAEVRRASPSMRLLWAHPQLFGDESAPADAQHRSTGWPSVRAVVAVAATTLAARVAVHSWLRRKRPNGELR